ncbi:TetR family transcriptional regulator [Nonomuraea salmonea]|jgi:AcrR family transcriptional regulator|uniref:TetR family transcriptional regulator n=1 Tax=Nonomuraea salmonea TaxID=46181 RepID=A0ABV5NGD2_9ACTN
MTGGGTEVVRRRDAARTRQRLLDAALKRFAHDGYAATTVRDITDDAGVNVALVNRYFQSKEGLFEACLEAASEELRRIADHAPIPDAIRHVITATGEGRLTDVLLLLLRTSGDERTERMRVGLLRSTSEDLAAAAGWRPDAPEGEQLMLRAQLVLALSVGVATLRVSTGLRPLATASDEDLAGPLRKAVDALLPRP